MNLLLAASAEVLSLESAVVILLCAGLLVLAKMVADLRREVRALRNAQPASPAPRQTPPAPPAAEGIPKDVFAAIVSAIHYSLGEQHHVIAISPVESMAWSREGRRSIFGSHAIR